MATFTKFTFTSAATSAEVAVRELDYFIPTLSGGSVVFEVFLDGAWQTHTTVSAVGFGKLAFSKTQTARARATAGSGTVILDGVQTGLTAPIASALAPATVGGGKGPPLVISGTPGQLTIGQPFSFTPVVTGGTGTKKFRLGGRLPAGLSFSAATGAITGTPTRAINRVIDITVYDDETTASLTYLPLSFTVGGGAAAANTRAMIQRVKAGASRGTILVIADSTGFSNRAGAYNTNRVNSVPTRMASKLSALGIPATAGSICGNAGQGSNYGAYDPRVNVGTWGFDGAKTTLGGMLFRSDANGAVFTVTPDANADTFEVISAQFSNGTLGAVGVTIGSAAPATGPSTISGNGATVAMVKNTVKAASASLAPLALTKTSASAFYLSTVKWWNSALPPQIDVVNASWPGSTSTNWNVAGSLWSPIDMIAPLAPSLVIIMLGINNWNQGLPLATFTSDIQAFITASKAAGADVLLVAQHETANSGGASQAVQQTFRDALSGLAASNGCLFTNWRDQLGSVDQAVANGLMDGDLIHPSLLGSQTLGDNLGTLIASFAA